MNVKKINILLVEDDIVFSRLFDLKMGKDPSADRFSFETVSNLEDCFKILTNGDIDIVLLDLGLTDTNGLETIEKFHETCPDSPVIVLTAHSEETIGIESIKKGASAFLEKNEFNTNELVRTILHSLERHEIQQQLKIEKQNVRDYLDLAGVIILSIDTDQQITMINKAGCKLLGYSDNELLGKNWFDIFSPSKKTAVLKENFSKIISNKIERPASFETVIVNAKGKHRVISWNRKFIRDKCNNIIGILGSGTDVTARKNSKRKLKNINNQIIEHDIQKNEFIINISHELRTPLTIFKNIISNAIAGTSGKINSKLSKKLNIADKAIERLAGIITDFLEISKIEAGKVKLNLDYVDVHQLIADAIDMHKSLIDSNFMTVEIDTPNVPIVLTADYCKMVQIMGKLIENATKFVPDCGGKMTIRATDMQDKICIEVQDNGPGIEGEDINRIFNRFIQIKRNVGEGEHGTGLGLTITKELVELHYGRIWVENIETGGTNFRMIIPKNHPASLKDESNTISQIDKTIRSLTDQADHIANICIEASTILKTDAVKKRQAPPIDWILAMKYCGDEKVIRKIVDSVIQESPNQLKRLIEAIKDQNSKDSVYYSHKLKGAILVLGATDLPGQAEIIELAAGENDFETINETMPQLLKEYDRFVAFFSNPNWEELAKRTCKNA